MPIEQHGIMLRRRDQQTATNVPHLVTHHSPTGYAWGYSGSGPADLALNILAWLLRREGYHGETVPCYEGHCFRLAWDLHQAFKRDAIATCDREDVPISLETVTHWLATYRLVTDPLQRSRPSPCVTRFSSLSLHGCFGRAAGQRAARSDAWSV
jgi:hypothetical protein